MSLESAVRSVPSPTPAPSPAAAWRRGTIRATPQIRRVQRIHAFVMTVLPALASVYAGWSAWQHGVSALELGLLVLMYTTTIAGITVGFHRLFSHAAFRAHPAVKAALAIAGSMAGQGPLFYWVSNHRRHHHHSDRPGDPHSPRFDRERPLSGLRGLWHAHMGWNFDHDLTNVTSYGKDLLRDPLLARINRHYYAWVALGVLLPAALGGLLSWSLRGAAGGLLWGGAVRLFFSYHATSGINSITHAFGSRPFQTREDSRNNLLLVLPTLGEGWHNNHHAFPSSAQFGLKPTQLDIGWLIIRALARLSLASEVRVPTDRQIRAYRSDSDLDEELSSGLLPPA